MPKLHLRPFYAFLIAGSGLAFQARAAMPSPTFTPTPGGAYSLLDHVVVNGEVDAIVTTATDIYLGGMFSQVGPRTGTGIVWNTLSDTRESQWPEFARGGVDAAAPDGSGGWYVGGEFWYVAGLPKRFLVHVWANGSLDPTFIPAPDGPVTALCVDNGWLYAVGGFGMIGGQSRPWIARLDPITGAADPAFNASPDNAVNTIAADGAGRLYAAGSFNNIGGQPRPYIACLDAITGAADPSFNATANASVQSLCLDGSGSIYVSGYFTSIGGLVRNSIAKLDAASGSAAAAFGASANALVLTLALDGSGSLYAGGTFTTMNGVSRTGIAKLNAGTGTLDGGFNALAGLSVNGLGLDGAGRVYVGGSFASMAGVTRNSFARLDAATGAVDSAFNVNANGMCNMLAQDPGGKLFLGGEYTSVGGVARANLAKVNVLTGALDLAFAPDPDEAVSALAIDGTGTLYAAGNFTTIGGVPEPFLAKLDGATGVVDIAFSGSAGLGPGLVRALALDSIGGLYAAGYFTSIGSLARTGLARLSAVTGAGDPGFNAGTDLGNSCLLLDGAGYLYAGGSGMTRLGKYDALAGVLDASFAPNPDQEVLSIAMDGTGSLYVGGIFMSIGGLSRPGLAKLNSSTGAADPVFDASPDAGPWALSLDGTGGLFVGGDFGNMGGMARQHLARLDVVSGAADPGFDPSPDMWVRVLAQPTGAQLYVGGVFWSIAAHASSGYAAFAVPIATATASPSATPTASPSATLTQTSTPTASPSPTPGSPAGCAASITTVAGSGLPGFGGDGGPAAAALLSFPSDMDLDEAGNVFFADAGNGRIRRIDAAGNITTVAGNGSVVSSGDGGPALAAGIYDAYGIVLNDAGDIFLTEFLGNRVRRIDAVTGIITTIAGNGIAGFAGDGGPAFASQVDRPDSLVVDSAGNLFITDGGNNRIRRIDGISGNISTVAGNGTQAYGGDGGAATTASLSAPFGIAINAAGDLYIADTGNHVIRRVSAATGIIDTVAGTGVSGTAGDGGPAIAGQLASPDGVVLSAAGDMIIADAGNNKVRWVEAATGIIRTLAGNGVQAYAGDGGPASSASLFTNYAVALDALGNVLIGDSFNHAIRKLQGCPFPVPTTPSHTPTVTLTPSPSPSPSETRTATPSASLSPSLSESSTVTPSQSPSASPTSTPSLSSTPAGPYAPAPCMIDTYAGTGYQGVSGDGGQATSADLFYPAGLKVDTAGNVYFAEYGANRVRKVDPSGIITTVAGDNSGSWPVVDGVAATATSIQSPIALALDSAGNLYIAHEDRVRRVDAISGIISTVAGGGAGGDGGLATAAALGFPSGLAIDAAGNLYIAEKLGLRVRRVDAATGIINTVAGNGIHAFSPDGSVALSSSIGFEASLVLPDGLGFNAAGDLLICETGYGKIRRIDSSGLLQTVSNFWSYDVASGPGGMTYFTGSVGLIEMDAIGNSRTVAGGGLGGDGGPALDAQLGGVYALAVSSSGDLYFSDFFDHRVRVVYACPLGTPSPTGSPSATLTATPSASSSASPTETPTVSATFTPSPSATATPCELIVSSFTVLAPGDYHFCRVQISGTLLIQGSVTITVDTDFVLDSGGMINGIGQGAAGGFVGLPGTGPGGGAAGSISAGGNGGAHGGAGGVGAGNGNAAAAPSESGPLPQFVGGGGGGGSASGQGGNGGAALLIYALGGTATLDGTIDMRAGAAVHSSCGGCSIPGGGAGGTIFVHADAVDGSGSLAVFGGAGDSCTGSSCYGGGGGGGGIISVCGTSVNNFLGYTYALGGPGGTGTVSGTAGADGFIYVCMPSLTPTDSPSPSSTTTPSATPTFSPTATPTPTDSPSPSSTVTLSTSPTPTSTVSASATPTATFTATLTETLTATPSITATETPSATWSATALASDTSTPSPSPSPTSSPAILSTSTPFPTGSSASMAMPPPGGSYAAPLPATGSSLQIVYTMAKPGAAELDVFNERGDLAAKLRDNKASGVQASRVELSGFSAGVYFYRVFLRYDDGSSQALPPGKFVRIR